MSRVANDLVRGVGGGGGGGGGGGVGGGGGGLKGQMTADP